MPYNSIRVLVAATAASLAATALCGTTTVTGSSGQTVVTQSVGSSGWWEANSSAETATITYDDHLSVISGNRHPFGTEFKCIDQGVFGPKTLTGLSDLISDASGSAGVSTGGSTIFSDPPPGVPRYYQTNWVATATTTGVGADASSGTYDPWKYTVAALQSLGIQPGGAFDFYFQVQFGAGSVVLPGAAEAGQFRFGAYATNWNATTIPFLSAEIARGPGGVTLTASQSADPNVTVYRLPTAVALNDTMTPTTKVSLGTLMGPGGVHANLAGNLSGIGGMIDDLYFGIIVHNFQTPLGLGANDTVFATHFDTFAHVGPVPEPATLTAIGTGLLLMLRRRRR